jgi:site-specific recombinase XerD
VYLRTERYAPLTIHWYQQRLVDMARWLATHGRHLASVRIEEVPRLVQCLSGNQAHAAIMYRAALHAWLRFCGRPSLCRALTPTAAWRSDLAEYDLYLAEQKGLALNTRIYRRRYARYFLTWKFDQGAADWRKITIQDVWRFAARYSQRMQPASANVMLTGLRDFLRYLNFRGRCAHALVAAVPHYAAFNCPIRQTSLTDDERNTFLRAYVGNGPRELRDRAMMLCLLDLGLRAQEVIQLTLPCIDWNAGSLKIPASKTAHERIMPLPAHVASALRRYVQTVRPTGCGDRLFLCDRNLRGRPFTISGLRQAIRRTFRRSGINRGCTGPHRLRHTFATRLYQHGLQLKHIADLLGHQALQTAYRYVQTDIDSLRALARPWPN